MGESVRGQAQFWESPLIGGQPQAPGSVAESLTVARHMHYTLSEEKISK